jgi:uncharacterized membrane protein
MWHANDGMGWWMVFGSVLWILFWVSVVYLVARAAFRPERRGEHTSDAIEIARRRFASGEITPQEYDEIVRHLRTPLGHT